MLFRSSADSDFVNAWEAVFQVDIDGNGSSPQAYVSNQTLEHATSLGTLSATNTGSLGSFTISSPDDTDVFSFSVSEQLQEGLVLQFLTDSSQALPPGASFVLLDQDGNQLPGYSRSAYGSYDNNGYLDESSDQAIYIGGLDQGNYFIRLQGWQPGSYSLDLQALTLDSGDGKEGRNDDIQHARSEEHTSELQS